MVFEAQDNKVSDFLQLKSEAKWRGKMWRVVFAPSTTPVGHVKIAIFDERNSKKKRYDELLPCHQLEDDLCGCRCCDCDCHYRCGCCCD